MRIEEEIGEGGDAEGWAPPFLRARRHLPLPVPPHGQWRRTLEQKLSRREVALICGILIVAGKQRGE